MSLINSLFQVRHAARLGRYGLLRVSGQDAIGFLQNQLTNDVVGLAPDQHQRSGYCTPKGRLLATMVQWKSQDGHVDQIMPATILEAVTKRLSMYVLRSKALIAKAEDRILYGLWGRPANGFEIGQTRQVGAIEMLRTEDCPVLGPRVWLVMPSADATETALLAKGPGASILPESAWQFSEIMAGLTWVWPETVEAFVPQMLNLELTKGVSFTKGCYPGQEIVARSQYLGKLKRRTFRADMGADERAKSALPSDALIGREVWSEHQPTEPVGQVVDAAAIRDRAGKEMSGLALLVSLSQDTWAAGGLRIGSPSGPMLIARDLPYSFPVAA